MYNMSTWNKVYEGELLLVSEPSDHTISADVTSVKMLPPKTRLQSGRRGKVRIHSTGEFSVSVPHVLSL